MAVIRRLTKAAPQSAAAPRRLMRRAAPATKESASTAAYTGVIEELKLIANLEREQDSLTRRRNEVEARIVLLMTAGGMTHADDGIFSADYKTTTGKSSTEIDILKLRKKLDEATFYKCLTPGITKVKQFLSEKEIAAISTVVPGKEGPAKLVIGRVRKSK